MKLRIDTYDKNPGRLMLSHFQNGRHYGSRGRRREHGAGNGGREAALADIASEGRLVTAATSTNHGNLALDRFEVGADNNSVVLDSSEARSSGDETLKSLVHDSLGIVH